MSSRYGYTGEGTNRSPEPSYREALKLNFNTWKWEKLSEEERLKWIENLKI